MKRVVKKRYLYLLVLLSSILLIAGWPANGFPLLLFVGFVPILFIEDYIFNNPDRFNRFSFFGYAYLAMFIFNLFTTYWIYYSTLVGVVLAVLLNSLFMSFTLALFHYTRTVLKHSSAYITFIVYWITFEYLHLNWDLTWSWMNLGNGFANYPSWIQWYEYTGCFGGTFWVLLANVMIFRAIRMYINKESTPRFRSFFAAACGDLILVPIIISLIIFYTYEDKGKPASVVIVQPNIDPYNEKFDAMLSEQQLAKILNLAKLKTDNKTDLLVGPETAIPEGVWEDKLDESLSIDSLQMFVKKYPQLGILMGMSSYKMFKKGEVISATARPYPYENGWYDAYNAAFMINASGRIQLYHKSKLVPGVEKMPYSKYLKFLEKYALDLGGIFGSLGVQDERTVFYSADKLIKAAPVICYESIYGEYVSDYVKNGANIICVITNDGWWKDTPGYKQHFSYARLRAIENRRSIVQSANTGISGFINQRGDVLQKTSWWKEFAIKQDVNLNEKITFYVKYGDYIARTASYMSVVIFIYAIFLSFSGRIKRVFGRKK
jgi:apolipoprotein N-acyltransferase